ncbi:MAG: glucans biosynthesis glucosyltransferase MdoH [Hyphomicrobiaceae bacterium]|nr:glucans biosynthesis glucosyltransferase MdoH [Hyphomicrobiaceae bacterium]
MTERQGLSTPLPAIGSSAVLTTPTGAQSMPELGRRRAVMVALNVVTYLLLMWGVAHVLSAGGWTLVDAVLLVAFAIGSPWTVLGFWNSVIGLWLLHGARDPMTRVASFAAAADADTPIGIRTAVLMTLRNEDPDRAFLRLETVKQSLDRSGYGGQFDYFILSDTNDPAVAAAEAAAAEAWRRTLPDADQVIYRRRTENTGYKAGNLRDFCERWGGGYELMLPLDADSLMSGDAIVRLVRIMQAHPRLGILQSLVVGMPSSSAFARIFQFGMRHGMRAYTMGQAWWVGDCGPFWGHNALVRIKPFAEECRLPMLPGKPPLGGHVLSHDQVEATLMRRAGYEVRVLPEERGSWEENPPTMLEFIRRDIRWCQGNIQYLKLLDLPGLLPMSRFQLVWAILMFLGIPAWTLMIALLPVLAWEAQGIADYPATLAVTLYAAFFAMYLSPKIAGLADAMLTPGAVARYGGRLRFAASAAIELVFSFLLGAVSTIRTSIFMIGLMFGKSVTWGGQSRDSHGIAWAVAWAALWPQVAFGALVCGALLAVAPKALLWSLPLTAGYLLAVPFAVLTAHPAVGRLFRRAGLCGIPEDFNPPPEVQAVQHSQP